MPLSIKGSDSRGKLISAIFFVVVVLLLLVMLHPALRRARESARRANCMSNVRQIGLAFAQYAVDNSGQYPFHSNDVAQLFLMLTNGNYLSPGKIYGCPSESPPRTGRPFVSSNISYGAVVYGGSTVTKESFSSSDQPLIVERGIDGARPSQPLAELIGRGWSAKNPHGTKGGNVFYLGGRASFESGAVFETNLLQNPTVTNAIVLLPE